VDLGKKGFTCGMFSEWYAYSEWSCCQRQNTSTMVKRHATRFHLHCIPLLFCLLV